MTSFAPADNDLVLSGEELRDAVVQYAASPIFVDNEEWTVEDNPYRRQVRPQVLRYLDFSTPLKRSEVLDYSSLAVQRLLTNIYEADLMFLPKNWSSDKNEDFDKFYDPGNRALGERIRPSLERFAFGFLGDEVEVSGSWTRESLEALLRELHEDTGNGSGSKAELAITQSRDPARAARMWLVQFAPDFLSEASAMMRNLLGAYGPAQSEWFKVVIDEYGYGVHDTKHSRLFEQTLTSVGLRDDLHHYWQYYLTSSLLLNNYFHYLGKNHRAFFRYLGALHYTETTLVDFCRQAVEVLRFVFGDQIDVRYFTEHVHIDKHHGRMALEKLILPIVDQCGEAVIPEIVRGHQEFQVLAEIADNDFADQVAWMDDSPDLKELHAPVWEAISAGRVKAPIAYLDEPRGELSNTHCHDGDELCHIVSGVMRFVTGLDGYEILEPGEGVIIRKNRLHGAIIDSDRCLYQIHSIGDVTKCV